MVCRNDTILDPSLPSTSNCDTNLTNQNAFPIPIPSSHVDMSKQHSEITPTLKVHRYASKDKTHRATMPSTDSRSPVWTQCLPNLNREAPRSHLNLSRGHTCNETRMMPSRNQARQNGKQPLLRSPVDTRHLPPQRLISKSSLAKIHPHHPVHSIPIKGIPKCLFYLRIIVRGS